MTSSARIIGAYNKQLEKKYKACVEENERLKKEVEQMKKGSQSGQDDDQDQDDEGDPLADEQDKAGSFLGYEDNTQVKFNERILDYITSVCMSKGTQKNWGTVDLMDKITKNKRLIKRRKVNPKNAYLGYKKHKRKHKRKHKVVNPDTNDETRKW